MKCKEVNQTSENTIEKHGKTLSMLFQWENGKHLQN